MISSVLINVMFSMYKNRILVCNNLVIVLILESYFPKKSKKVVYLEVVKLLTSKINMYNHIVTFYYYPRSIWAEFELLSHVYNDNWEQISIHSVHVKEFGVEQFQRHCSIKMFKYSFILKKINSLHLMIVINVNDNYIKSYPVLYIYRLGISSYKCLGAMHIACCN